MVLPTILSCLTALGISYGTQSPSSIGSIAYSNHAAIVATVDEGPIVHSEEGRFHIQLPPGFAEPTSSVSEVPTKLGTLSMTTMTSTLGGGQVCMIAYADYPEDAIAAMGENTRKVLDGAQSGAIGKMEATLTSQRDIRLDGILGRSFRFKMSLGGQSGYGQFNVFLIGARMYQICYISTNKKKLDNAGVKKYFTSFRLVSNSQ